MGLRIENVITLALKKDCILKLKPLPEEITLDQTAQLNLTGWVVGINSPISQIEIICNNQLINTINVNQKRPQLVSKFPHYPWAENSGFNTTIEIPENQQDWKILLKGITQDSDHIELALIQGKISTENQLNKDRI